MRFLLAVLVEMTEFDFLRNQQQLKQIARQCQDSFCGELTSAEFAKSSTQRHSSAGWSPELIESTGFRPSPE
jgi:hypothetical protein